MAERAKVISIRLHDVDLARLDAIAGEMGVSRTEAFRALLNRGREADERVSDPETSLTGVLSPPIADSYMVTPKERPRPAVQRISGPETVMGGVVVPREPEMRAAVPISATQAVIACEHKEKHLLGGGMARCKACDAVRGANGVWRG